jgi:hypothetical protein
MIEKKKLLTKSSNINKKVKKNFKLNKYLLKI